MGRHGTADGSFARSAGTAAFRGALLIAAAVVIGVVLLSQGLDDDTEVRAADNDRAETTTPADGDEPAASSPTTSPDPRPPNEVKVLAANGSGVPRAAGTLTEQLQRQGYVVLEPANARSVQATIVYYAEGFQREAARLAQTIGANVATVQAMPVPPPVAEAAQAHVLVVLGPDLAKPS